MADRTLPILGKRRQAITAGLLLGMSLGALEATVVGTAMPTIDRDARRARALQLGVLGVSADLNRVGPDLGPAVRPVRPPADVSDRGGRLSRRLGGVRRRHHDGPADRRAGGAGPRRRRHHSAHDDDHRRALHAGGAAAHAGAVQRRLGHRVACSGRSSAATSPTRSSWRWVFYINIPFGLLCVAVIASAYPASRGDIAGEGGLAGRGPALRGRERAAHRPRRRDAAGGRGARPWRSWWPSSSSSGARPSRFCRSTCWRTR